MWFTKCVASTVDVQSMAEGYEPDCGEKYAVCMIRVNACSRDKCTEVGTSGARNVLAKGVTSTVDSLLQLVSC